MTDREIEKAFDEAQKKWLDESSPTFTDRKKQRYFFFAGSEFGLAQAKKIYGESMENVGKMIGETK